MSEGLQLVLLVAAVAGIGIAFGVSKSQISMFGKAVDTFTGRMKDLEDKLTKASERLAVLEYRVNDTKALQAAVDRLDSENKAVFGHLHWTRRGGDRTRPEREE